MTEPIVVTDAADPLLDDYRHLRDPATRKRVETQGAFFIAEGVTVIERLLQSHLGVRSVLLTPKRHARLADGLRGVSAPILIADREILRSIAGFDLHRGAVAAVHRPIEPALAEVMDGSRSICALEGIVDHENLGAIIRSAVAFGVDALVLDPTCADPWYRRSVRVSMGTIFDLPITRSEAWPADLGRARERGFRILAMTLGPDAVPITQVEPGGKTIVMLGSEGRGLSEAAVAMSDIEMKVPMRPGVDSLNVGHAAAVALHRLASDPPTAGER